MRLIDADEVMIKLNGSCNMNCLYTKKQRDVMCDSCLLGDAKDYIDSMPTIDAVSVVRCKDCKWRGDLGCAITIVDESDKPRDDDFCAWGERREER